MQIARSRIERGVIAVIGLSVAALASVLALLASGALAPHALAGLGVFVCLYAIGESIAAAVRERRRSERDDTPAPARPLGDGGPYRKTHASNAANSQALEAALDAVRKRVDELEERVAQLPDTRAVREEIRRFEKNLVDDVMSQF